MAVFDELARACSAIAPLLTIEPPVRPDDEATEPPRRAVAGGAGGH